MKKLVTAFTACMIAGLVSAQVNSQNVVGYYTVTIPAQQYTMLGLSFDQVGAVDQGIPVNGTGALIPDPIGAGFAPGANAANADQMQFWTGTGYISLYLFDTTATAPTFQTRKNKWMNPAAVPNTAVWGAAGQPSQYKAMTGDAFWLKRKTGSYASPIANVPFAGQVVTGNLARVINEGYNLIAGSHSTAFVPNPDIAGTGSVIDWKTMGAWAGQNAASADQMQFWTGTGYISLYLFDTTSTVPTFQTRKNKWMNPAAVPSTDTWGAAGQPSKYQTPLGQGFWYKRLAGKGTFTLSETQPYTLN